MSKRTILALFVLVVLICVLNSRVHAQVDPSCIDFVYPVGPSGYMPAPPNVYDCQLFEFYGVGCKIQTRSCPPADAQLETCCGPGCNDAAAGKPISLASGNTYIVEKDVSIPGLSGGLRLERTWNSLWPVTQSAYQIGLFGPNWRSTYEERVFLGDDHYVKYSRSDGSFWSFGYSGGSVSTWAYGVAAPANVTATLTTPTTGPTSWTLTFQNGERREFDSGSGKLIAIIDRNGNTTTLSYDSLSRLVTVTDPASRHLYFAYGDGSSYLVTSVTSDVGISVSYSYDSQGRLSQVTEPDQSTLSFQYDSHSLISAVLDANGKILESHTYDSSGRGLTSSRANGVDAVTISYGNH